MDYAAPYPGNFIPSIKNLEKHLNQNGSRLIYLLPKSAQKIEWVIELQKDCKTVYFIDNSFFSKKIKYSNIKRLKDIIEVEKINIIHTHFIEYNYTLALVKKLFILKVGIIGNFMNEYLPPQNIYTKFKIFITKITFDIIVASSSAVKESVIVSGINKIEIATIYNALDTDHLQKYNIHDFRDNVNQKIILMFGWTFHRKGVDIAIKSIKELIDQNLNIKLVIASSGGQEIIKNEIIKLLGEMPSWITLLGPNTNVASYYNSTDIFLSSSREEGFTYSVLEASFCNSMIIVSEIGGHPLDVPFVGKFESENIWQLKTEIKKMLGKTTEEIKAINEAQKKHVVRMYDVNNWSEKIIKLYTII